MISRVVVPACNPTSNGKVFLFLHILASICCHLSFRDRVSLYSPGCPGTHFVDQAGLELRNQPASASRVLEFKVCISTAGLGLCTFKNYYLLNVYEYTVAVSDKQEEGIRSHYR